MAWHWLEVPLARGYVAFISPEGRSLPNPGAPLSADGQCCLDAWSLQLRQGVSPCVKACLDAGVHLHEALAPINQAAWDWIPASPHPFRLEGKGDFGLLVPQLVAQLNTTTLQP